MSLMEQKLSITEECRQKFVATFARSCLFWIPAQTLNFVLVPPKFRVVYVGSCAFAWVNILCWIKRQQIISTTKTSKHFEWSLMVYFPIPIELYESFFMELLDSKTNI